MKEKDSELGVSKKTLQLEKVIAEAVERLNPGAIYQRPHPGAIYQMLAQLRETNECDDYHDWGYQIRMVNNDKYCGKLLVLENKWRSSYHYHKVKQETFIVLVGHVFLYLEHEGLGEERTGSLAGYCEKAVAVTLEPGQQYTIDPTDRHWMRMSGASKIAVILEVSTHDDDEDTYRLPHEDADEEVQTRATGKVLLVTPEESGETGGEADV